MRCPKCGSKRTRVTDTRQHQDNRRRRYFCMDCNMRFSTNEKVGDIPQVLPLQEVMKASGPLWICYPQETYGPQKEGAIRINCTRYAFDFSEYGKTWVAFDRNQKEECI